MSQLAPLIEHQTGRIPERLPDFTTARECLAKIMGDFGPQEQLTVSESAAKYRRLQALNYRGPWDNDAAPYMCEPCDTAMSRRFKAGVFIGPARSLKTSAFVENVVAHFLKVAPRTVRIIGADQKLSRELSVDKIAPMLRASPDLKARQLTGRGSDSIYEKLFRDGMRLTFGWPVMSQLSQADIPVVLFPDYDRIKNMDVDGQGDPFILGRKRNQTFGSLGWTALETSPGFEITSRDWYAKTPHEAPPTRGGLSHYNNGTKGRFYWHCPHCGERFEPTFELIKYSQDKSIPNAMRAAGAYMLCPSEHGCVITDADKMEANRNGVWLHEARDTDNGGLCLLSEEDRIIETTIASWWLMGAPARFQSMVEMVEAVLNAESEFDRTQSETSLKGVVNTTLGLPYLSRLHSDESELNSGALWDRAEGYDLGTLPAWARYFAYHVDVQGNRFVVQAMAYGPGLESQVVQRFDIITPAAGAPGFSLDGEGAPSRQLEPAKYVEDWNALEALEARALPVSGADYALRPAGVTIDSVGAPGVTDNARKFWRKMRRRKKHMRFHLVQGSSRDYGNRVERRRPEQKTKDRFGQISRSKSDVPIVFMVSNRLKDEVMVSLMRTVDGTGRMHLTKALGRTFFDELCAEERIDEAWTLKAGEKRNEAFDLAYHAKAFAVLMGVEEADWDAPKQDWLREGSENPLAVELTSSVLAPEDPASGGAEGVVAIQDQPVMTRQERYRRYVMARQGRR